MSQTTKNEKATPPRSHLQVCLVQDPLQLVFGQAWDDLAVPKAQIVACTTDKKLSAWLSRKCLGFCTGAVRVGTRMGASANVWVGPNGLLLTG
jgi:hypothetical protein